MKKPFYTYLLGTILLLSPLISLAMTETTDGGQLTATISPQNPGPFTSTSIHLVSYEVDLSRTDIAWTINGVKQKESVGLSDFQFNTGPAGKKINIEITASVSDGKVITKQISFIPADVDLFWQSDGYVPSFYRGKSLATKGGKIKLTAAPTFINEAGQKIDPQNLIYSWRLNSSSIGSGIGLNTILTNTDENNSENTYSVDVASLNGNLNISKTIVINTTNPQLLLYEVKPLSGVSLSHSLPDVFSMNGDEMTIKVEPFFANTSNIKYLWGLNNETPVSEQNSSHITIRQPRGRGESILTSVVDILPQPINKSITIQFGNNAYGL